MTGQFSALGYQTAQAPSSSPAPDSTSLLCSSDRRLHIPTHDYGSTNTFPSKEIQFLPTRSSGQRPTPGATHEYQHKSVALKMPEERLWKFRKPEWMNSATARSTGIYGAGALVCVLVLYHTNWFLAEPCALKSVSRPPPMSHFPFTAFIYSFMSIHHQKPVQGRELI